MTIFSECLKYIRDAHDMSTSELAGLAERDITTVHRWCNGSRTPSSFEPIVDIANQMGLSALEKKQLEDSYMETVYGPEKYQHYLTIKNMLHYLYEECRTMTHRKSKAVFSIIDTETDQETKSFFLSLENHRDLVNAIISLIQTTSSEDTIYLKLTDPIIEIFNIIFYNLTIFGPRKNNIIFCMSNQELFNQANSYEIFKNLCEMFLYNKDCTIYLTKKKTLSIESHKNCIFTGKQAIYFDHAIQKGISTNYPEWIRDVTIDYEHLERKSRLIGHKNTLVIDYTKYFSENDQLTCYEFMPCVTLAQDRTFLENHIYQDIPNREEFIETILKNYTMEYVGMMNLVVTSCEEGMRTFMETGKLTIFPYPVYDPFSMAERKILMQRIISYNKSDDCSLKVRFQKNMEISNVPCLEFQINEYAEHEEMSNVNLIIILKDLTTHKIFFHSPALIQCCKDYLEVIHNPYYCYTQEETLAIMKKVLEEY